MGRIESGNVFKSNSSGDFVVIEDMGCNSVLIEFLETKTQRILKRGKVKSGNVRDHNAKSIFNVGVTGCKYPTKVGGKRLREYELWRGMLRRCYSSEGRFKTYSDTEVSENFKHYEYFYDWCPHQIGFENEGWCLDKDLLSGGLLYSEETCVFIPEVINLAVSLKKSIRGDLPIGISHHKKTNTYISQVSMYGTPVKLGYYKTKEEAFSKYKLAKERYLKELANTWYGKIDKRVYEILINYDIHCGL